MQKDMVRKGFIVGIMILFVGASIIPSISGDLRELKYNNSIGCDLFESIKVNKLSSIKSRNQTFFTDFEDGTVGDQYYSDWLTTEDYGEAYITDAQAHSGWKSYLIESLDNAVFHYIYNISSNMTATELWVKTNSGGGSATLHWKSETSETVITAYIFNDRFRVYTFSSTIDIFFANPGTEWHRIGWYFNAIDNVTYWVDDPDLGNYSMGSPLSGSLERINRLYLYSNWDWYYDDHSICIDQEGNQPIIFNESPINNSINVERPPTVICVAAEDPDGDLMDIYIRCMNHNGEWVTLETYNGVGNGTYNTINFTGNDWIWGNTTYVWSVNVTDGTTWTNETYEYTTSGSRYDVSNNDLVNFQDAGLVWVHRTSEEPYDGLYDVNQDGTVNFQDAGLTWINRD